jgi:hypothetical protein
MQYNGDMWLVPAHAVMVKGRKDKVVHALACSKIAVQSELDALIDKSPRKNLPRHP